jgi:hypothetical protein
VTIELAFLALSARHLHHLRSTNAALEKPISRPPSVAALLGAGVIHGIYASGGPMLVYAVGREGLTKKVFRSTLSMVWIVLNVILVARFLLAGDYDREAGLDILLLVPAVPHGGVGAPRRGCNFAHREIQCVATLSRENVHV